MQRPFVIFLGKFQFIEQLQALGNNTLSLWESWQKSLIFD